MNWSNGYIMIDINKLSKEQIEKSQLYSSDSAGNEMRAVWSKKQNCYLMFFVEKPQPPQPIKIPTLSEISG